MQSVMQNCMIEWSYTSETAYSDPFNDIELSAVITEPDGHQITVPAFWAGGNTWRVRYASPKMGIHHVSSFCSDRTNKSLHGREQDIRIGRYDGGNLLMKHGPLKVSANGKYLEHEDGTPFFWLADTWWMGLSKRLSWPDDFKTLAADRASKGFSVIQIVAGLYPDMVPMDERGANEAGFPWNDDFSSINPGYFEMADRRIDWLVQSGLVPCIVGCWGYYIDFARVGALKKHWRYLCARYGAYPAVWCMAGEALMPFYGSVDWVGENKEKYKKLWNDPDARLEYQKQARKGWTEVTRYLTGADPWNHPITIHPTDFGHKMVEDRSLLDFELLQTGHGSWNSLPRTADMMEEALKLQPAMPVINGEVCYEGIGGSNYADVQRFAFWSCILSGAAGHTYGADGIWQVNCEEKPFGASPQGVTWGNTPWKTAYRLPGAEQLGRSKKFLERYPWWDFAPHAEWCEPHAQKDSRIAPYAAGIEGKVRMIFIPFCCEKPVVKNIEKDITYQAFYFNPVNGEEYKLGAVLPEQDGRWRPEHTPVFSDLVLVLEKR